MNTKNTIQEHSERLLRALLSSFLTAESPDMDAAARLRDISMRCRITRPDLSRLLADTDFCSRLRTLTVSLGLLETLLGHGAGKGQKGKKSPDTEDIEAVRRQLTAVGEEG